MSNLTVFVVLYLLASIAIGLVAALRVHNSRDFAFAGRLYRLNLLTIGDYYRLRYNRTVEVLCTLAIVGSYLGWVSAQIKALGLVFHVVTDGAVAQPIGMMIGAA